MWDSKGATLPLTQSVTTRRIGIKAVVSIVIFVVSCVYYLSPAVTTHEKNFEGREIEDFFLTIPNEDSCIEMSRLLTAVPHPAASEGDYETAKQVLYHMQRELGIQPPETEPVFAAGSPESQEAIYGIPKLLGPRTWIDTYYPVMNWPLERALQVLDENETIVWEADLEEQFDNVDPAGRYGDAVPAFHGYSHDGDVTGKLIYANYGTKTDYDELVSQGVNFTGAIVLARYGGNLRGLKVKGAEDLGAVGVIIYSDPRDDGVVTMENGFFPYPAGPARHPDAIQRGSVQYVSEYPGDPTTPGFPSYPNATRVKAQNLASIPSLPLSWKNAQMLFFNYLDTKFTIRLVNHNKYDVMPIWNNIAVIPGHIRDEVVIVGNHRDAWVLGAGDPTSGTASMFETIRGLGALLKEGWKPMRTIVIACWDAEEYGLIGSTEWGEDFANWLRKSAVAYLNLDASAAGSQLHISASPLLAHVSYQAALDLPHPTDPGRSLWDASKDMGPYYNASSSMANLTPILPKSYDSLGIGVLGSGSDFTVFLQHLGVSSMGHEFGTTPYDAVYHDHSVYDSERWMELYGDPGFHRHVAIAKHQGLVLLRLADGIVLPLNTTHYVVELKSYVDKVQETSANALFNVDLRPLRHSLRSLQASSELFDIEKVEASNHLTDVLNKIHQRPKKLRKMICHIAEKLGYKCRSFESKIDELDQDTCAVAASYVGYNICGTSSLPKFLLIELLHSIKRIRAVNRKLIAFERGFVTEEGIHGREWYKHLGVAPGKWLGYDATTLPALTEAITVEEDPSLAKYEVARLQSVFDGLTDLLLVDNVRM